MAFQNAQSLPCQFHLFICFFLPIYLFNKFIYGLETQAMREAGVLKAFELGSGKEQRIVLE